MNLLSKRARQPCRSSPEAEAEAPPSVPLRGISVGPAASQGGTESVHVSNAGSAFESDSELLSEAGFERFARESEARPSSEGQIVRKKRTRRPLSGVRKKPRTGASAFLPVSVLPSGSSLGAPCKPRAEGRLGDPSAPAPEREEIVRNPQPSILDRTTSKLSMDALAKAAAVVEGGDFTSPNEEEGGNESVREKAKGRSGLSGGVQ